MQRRSFVKKLFGVVLAGLAAPRVGMAAAEPMVLVDPATPFYNPMVGGAYAPGEAFNITKRLVTVPMQFSPRYYEVAVPEITIDSD